MKLSERLYNLRKEAGLSQEELAGLLNVSRQTISKWETGESNPDIDKIGPLCEIFNITADELIRGIKIENNKEEKDIEEDNSELEEYMKKEKRREALIVSGSVFMYILSVIWIILAEEIEVIGDNLMICIFFLIIAIPTCLLIYYYISRSNRYKKNKIKEIEENKNPKLENIKDIITLIFVALYFLISFITMGWYITWIIWVIYALVIKIVEIIFNSKGSNNNE